MSVPPILPRRAYVGESFRGGTAEFRVHASRDGSSWCLTRGEVSRLTGIAYPGRLREVAVLDTRAQAERIAALWVESASRRADLSRALDAAFGTTGGVR